MEYLYQTLDWGECYGLWEGPYTIPKKKRIPPLLLAVANLEQRKDGTVTEMKKAGWVHVQTKLNWLAGHSGDNPLYIMLYHRECPILTKAERTELLKETGREYRVDSEPMIYGGCGLEYRRGFNKALKDPMLHFLCIPKKDPLTAKQAESLKEFHYSKVVETPLSDFYLNGFLPTKWTRKLDERTNRKVFRELYLNDY